MKKFLITFLLSTISVLFAQNDFSISGTVKDSATGEDMIGVVILDKSTNVAVETNDYGFYSIQLSAGEHLIKVVYSGYNTKEFKIMVINNEVKNIFLSSENVTTLKEVVITNRKADDHVDNIKISTNNLDIAQIKTLPALFGEVDVIKNIQTLPGVQSAGEGTTGFFVRGGGADQNMILLDEAPVYNASHVLGFFSVFNSEVLKNAELYKGNIPAQYGGRLSSLLDIRTKDGNMNRLGGSASLGLISGKFLVEGPIKKDKSSFIISGRRSWADVFLKMSPKKNVQETQLYFYDLNAKFNYKINEKNRVFVAGYFGKDVMNLGKFGISWGNSTGTLRWNHIFNSKVFSNTSLIFSNFDYNIKVGLSSISLDWISNIKEVGLKQDFNIFATNKIELNTGFQLNYRYFKPGTITFKGDMAKSFSNIEMSHLQCTEEAVYLNADYKLDPKWFIQYGIRVTSFQQVGNSTMNLYKDNIVKEENLIGTKSYKQFEIMNTDWAVEPRMAVRHKLNTSTSIKASVSRNVQFLNLISNATIPLPTAMWIPAGRYIKPQYSNQIATGLFKNFAENMFETSVEVYYKKMFDLTDFKDNARTFFNKTLETEISQGTGKSYGSEFFIKKNRGRLTGWISYTLSKSTKTIEGVNGGREFRADYDRRHNFNVIANYELPKNWVMGTAWVYSTGRPYTLATGYTMYDGYKMPTYTERNGYVMPAFHRLDFSFTKKWKSDKHPHLEKLLNLSVYNAYYRKNPYFITMDDKLDANGDPIPNEKVVNKTWLLPIIPSVSYTINF